MNDFIDIELSPKNEFRCEGSFELFGAVLDKLNFKIDTGCPMTTIPLSRTPLSPSVIEENKQEDYRDTAVKKQISFGLNDSTIKRKTDKTKFKQGLYDQLDSVTCTKRVKNFVIAGYNFGDLDIKVSYTRTGNILIGMDILQNCDIHIAKSGDHQIRLLACPNNKLNDSYLLKLEELYQTGTLINSAILRRGFR